MRISGIHVAGFGRIDGLSLTDLDHPLIVIEGPNGSGKTSLMEFVTGVLTGFPRGNTKRRKYPPLSASRHGGSLELTIHHRRADLSRFLPDNEVVLSGDPDAVKGVREVISGLSASFYRGLLAFDVDSLSRLDLMSDREINDLVYGAGSTASGVSPHRALTQLRARAAELYRPRGKQPALNRRVEELDRARTELRLCRARTGETAGLRARIGALEAELEDLRSTRARLSRELWRLEAALSMWSGHLRAEQRRRDRQRLHAAVSPAVLTRMGERRSSVEAVLTEAGSLPEIESQIEVLTSRLGRIRAQAAEARGLLGQGWTPERVQRTRVNLSETAEGENLWAAVREAAADLDQCHRNSAEAAASRENAIRHQQRTRAEIGGRDPGPTGERARRIKEAAEEIIDIERRIAAGGLGPSALSFGHPENSAGPRGPVMVSVATAAAAVAFLGAGWLLASDLPGAAVALLGLGVLLALIPTGLLSPARALVTHRDTDPLRERHRELTAEILTEAPHLGFDLGSGPGRRFSESETSTVDLARLPVTTIVARAERIEEAAAAAAAADTELDEAHTLTDSAHQEEQEARIRHEQALKAWRTWAERLGLPADRDGPAMATMISRLTEARHLEIEAEATGEEVAELAHRRARLLAGLATVHRDLLAGTSNASCDPPADICAELTDLLRLHDRAERLDSQLLEWDERVREQAGDRVAEVLATLEENDPRPWRRRVEAIGEEIPEVDSRIEKLAGELRSTRDHLEHLEGSAEIAERAQSVAVLEDSAAELWKRFCTLNLAAELIEETLRRHEARRQPEVVRSASRIFSRVTAGVYGHLVVREGAVVVVDAGGSEISPSALSRGTLEQLYMSLRLALIEIFVSRHRVPVVLDEVLVDFDPLRSSAMIAEIRNLTELTQVLVFTCHPSTAAEIIRAAPWARHVTLGDHLSRAQPLSGQDQSP